MASTDEGSDEILHQILNSVKDLSTGGISVQL
jgi:hypothetical protein